MVTIPINVLANESNLPDSEVIISNGKNSLGSDSSESIEEIVMPDTDTLTDFGIPIEKTSSPDSENLLGNVISNPKIQYSTSDSTISGWKISATTDISRGTTLNLKMDSTVSSGRRSLVDGTKSGSLPTSYPYLFTNESNSSDTFFMSSTGGTSEKTFSILSQTVENLVIGEEYIFNLQYKLNGTSRLYAAVYPGTAIAGAGALAAGDFKNSTDDYVNSDIAFTATSTQATISFRNYFRGDTNQITHIKSVGFYRTKDFEVQKSTFALFENMTSGSESLYNSVTSEQVNALEAEAQNMYSEEAKTEVLRLLKIANDILATKKDIQNKIDNLYVDGVIKDNADENFEEISKEIDQLNDGELKDSLTSELDSAENALKLKNAKAAAQDVLDKKYATAIEEIEQNNNLTDEEKTKAKDKLLQTATNGKESIDKAENVEDINNIVENTNNIIDGIVSDYNLQAAKNKAIQEVDEYATNAINLIANNKNLTQNQKDEAISQINEILNKSIADINNSIIITDIQPIVDKAKADIDSIVASIPGDLTLESVPNFNFGTNTILGLTTNYTPDAANSTGDLSISDLRGTGVGWHVTAALSPFKNEEDYSLKGSELILPTPLVKSVSRINTNFSDFNEIVSLTSDGTAFSIGTAPENQGQGIWNITWEKPNLKVVTGTAMVGNNRATIEWTLYNTP